MKPRVLSSKKWTPFPKDFVNQIEQAFSEAFPDLFKNAKLIIDGRIYPEEILLRVGYLEKGRLHQNNFETSVNHLPGKQDTIERIHHLIDAAASLMNEYIQSEGEVDFPRQWKEYDFDQIPIWVQYTTVNTELESEADRLLGLSKSQLVNEDSDVEDALAHSAEILPQAENEEYFEGEDEDDEDVDLSKPSLFSGKKKQKKEDMH